jgi:mannose-1-phosphate guanylyltransferase
MWGRPLPSKAKYLKVPYPLSAPLHFLSTEAVAYRLVFQEKMRMPKAGNVTSCAFTVLFRPNHRFLVKEEVERAGITPRAIILEPLARNTATAVAIAALYLEHEPGAILAVMP